MKGVLLSLITVSSLISLPVPALANGIHIQAGPVGLSIGGNNNNYRNNRRPKYIQRRQFDYNSYTPRQQYIQRRSIPCDPRQEYVQGRQFDDDYYTPRQQYIQRRSIPDSYILR